MCFEQPATTELQPATFLSKKEYYRTGLPVIDCLKEGLDLAAFGKPNRVLSISVSFPP